MKFTFIFFLIFFVFNSLFSEEPSLQEKMEVAKMDWEKINFEFYISPLIIADVGVGLSQRMKLKKVYHEGTFILHADLIPHFFEKDIEEFYKIYIWGGKYRSAYFNNADYSGFNWFFNVGFQSIFINIYGAAWIPFPDLAVGCGYSWKFDNDHHFRISLDAGLKVYISNLYFSYVW